MKKWQEWEIRTAADLDRRLDSFHILFAYNSGKIENDKINTIGQKAPLKAGAYFHARFENIHPFADGNGRVGRMLLNYWLMINNHPPMIIYEEDRCAYYDALQAYDEQEDLDLLTEFFEEQTVKT